MWLMENDSPPTRMFSRLSDLSFSLSTTNPPSIPPERPRLILNVTIMENESPRFECSLVSSNSPPPLSPHSKLCQVLLQLESKSLLPFPHRARLDWNKTTLTPNRSLMAKPQLAFDQLEVSLPKPFKSSNEATYYFLQTPTKELQCNITRDGPFFLMIGFSPLVQGIRIEVIVPPSSTQIPYH